MDSGEVVIHEMQGLTGGAASTGGQAVVLSYR